MKKMVYAVLMLVGLCFLYGSYSVAQPVIHTMQKADYIEAKVTGFEETSIQTPTGETTRVIGYRATFDQAGGARTVKVMTRAEVHPKLGDMVELYVLPGSQYGLPLSGIRITEFAWTTAIVGVFCFFGGLIGLCLNLKRKGTP